MRNVIFIAVMMMVSSTMFAGTPNKKSAQVKKSSTVYVWKGESHGGIWYHSDAKCASCHKDVIGEGKLYIMTEKGAKGNHVHGCPVCTESNRELAMNVKSNNK